ncbi:amidohydrolase [Bacillota bacterium]
MAVILKNGKIYTVNPDNPWADTLVYEGETITYVGNERSKEWLACAGANPKIIDLKGKMVIPGFVDSHTHPGMVSQSTWHIRLPWTEDPDELLAFVADYAKKHPAGEVPFLYFEYYPTSMFGNKGPTKEMLDKAVSDRPCLCQDFGDHMHWVNSKMLEMMEVDKNTPDPTPGLEVFVRDEQGEPTGWVKEYAWVHFSETLFKNIGWEPPLVMTPELMQDFFLFMEDNGVTALGEGILEGEAQLESMQALDQQGKLHLYYDGLLRFWSLAELPDRIKELRNYQGKYTGKHIKINTMKLFLDGTNESGNSALLEAHLNDPSGSNFGEIKMSTEELKDCMVLLNKEELDLHIHVVGDRGFRVCCDAVELAQREAAAAKVPWVMQVVLAHCELVHPDDQKRPAQLGITINWSCHWAGGYFGEEAIPFIGKGKWESMYQFNPMIDSGALVALSSDVVTFYELRRANPFFGMQVSHTRIDPEYPLDENRYPGSVRPAKDACMSREFLLQGYTLNAAKQLRWGHMMGSLEKGKLANMVIINEDFFTVPPSEIRNIQIEAVVFEGMVLRGHLG